MYPSYRVETRNQDTGVWQVSNTCPPSPKLEPAEATLDSRKRAIALAKAAYRPAVYERRLFGGFKQTTTRPNIDVRVVETTRRSAEVAIWKNGEWID